MKRFFKAPHRSRGIIAVPPLLFFAAAVLCGCEPGPVRRSEFLMDTSISITAYGRAASDGLNAAFASFEKVESLMSAYRPDSEVSRLNAEAGKNAVRLSPETFRTLAASLQMARASGGAFDPTIGPLVEVWNIRQGAESPVLPGAEAVEAARRRVDYARVRLNAPNRTAYLSEPGMRLDLGGSAKGFAAGLAAEAMRKSGVQHALIDAGGNIVTVGVHPENRLWRVGIRHPREPGSILGSVGVADMAVVTSGDYERYFELGGRRYHHLLNPATGYPASGLQSVTIVGPDSLQADLLSTAVFVLGLERGMKLLEKYSGFGAVFVDDQGRIHTTPGFAEQFQWNPGG